MEPFPLRGHHVLVAHQHQRPVALPSFPPVQQVAVDLRLFHRPVYQRKQFLQHFMEAQEFLPLILSGNGNRLVPDHRGQFPGIRFRPLRIRRGRVVGFPSWNQHRPDYCRQQQEQHQAQTSQENPHDDHFPAAPFVSLRYFSQLSPIASAPLGMIMKLVEEVSDGTSVNRMTIAASGITASFGSFR